MDPKPTKGSKNNEPEPPLPDNTTKVDPKGHPSDNGEQSGDSKTAENCDGALDKSCKVQGTMIACIKGVQSGKFTYTALGHTQIIVCVCCGF